MKMQLNCNTPDGLFEAKGDTQKFWVMTDSYGKKSAMQLADSPERPQFGYIPLGKDPVLEGSWLGALDLAVSGEPGGSYIGRCGFIVETGGRFHIKACRPGGNATNLEIAKYASLNFGRFAQTYTHWSLHLVVGETRKCVFRAERPVCCHQYADQAVWQRVLAHEQRDLATEHFLPRFYHAA